MTLSERLRRAWWLWLAAGINLGSMVGVCMGFAVMVSNPEPRRVDTRLRQWTDTLFPNAAAQAKAQAASAERESTRRLASAADVVLSASGYPALAGVLLDPGPETATDSLTTDDQRALLREYVLSVRDTTGNFLAVDSVATRAAWVGLVVAGAFGLALSVGAATVFFRGR